VLVLKRKEGQTIEVEHVGSGERFWFRAYEIMARDGKPQVTLAFDDPDHHFRIDRSEKVGRRHEEPSWN
jgi:hypothetical protein